MTYSIRDAVVNLEIYRHSYDKFRIDQNCFPLREDDTFFVNKCIGCSSTLHKNGIERESSFLDQIPRHREDICLICKDIWICQQDHRRWLDYNRLTIFIVDDNRFGNRLKFFDKFILWIDACRNWNNILLDISFYLLGHFNDHYILKWVLCSGKTGLRGISASIS